MTTEVIYEERGSDWSNQVYAVGTTRWLRDQTLPLFVKGVTVRLGDCYTSRTQNAVRRDQ